MEDVRFKELLSKQYILDETIRVKHGYVKQELISKKIISLEVELSEFANEIRFFKFWSLKDADYKNALTEYVDALHFYLSIAIDFDIDFNMSNESDIGKDSDLLGTYIRCKKWSLDIYTNPEPSIVWHLAFCWFWSLGQKVGFTEDEIYKEYMEKNSENHRRQEQGY